MNTRGSMFLASCNDPCQPENMCSRTSLKGPNHRCFPLLVITNEQSYRQGDQKQISSRLSPVVK